MQATTAQKIRTHLATQCSNGNFFFFFPQSAPLAWIKKILPESGTGISRLCNPIPIWTRERHLISFLQLTWSFLQASIFHWNNEKKTERKPTEYTKKQLKWFTQRGESLQWGKTSSWKEFLFNIELKKSRLDLFCALLENKVTHSVMCLQGI